MLSTPAENGMYRSEQFANQQDRSAVAARAILPLVLQDTRARSVLDLGCGVGTWLAACAEHGITDYLGLDGDYATPMLTIPADHFRAVDLRESPASFGLTRRYDLAISMEVMEHLPSTVGPDLIALLCSRADRVLFSAAIPGQSGPGHINERWQSYWAAHFALHGFAAHDVIRPKVWADASIPFWYRQNVLLYVKQDSPVQIPPMLDVVHPDRFTQAVQQANEPPYISGGDALRILASKVTGRLTR